MDEFVQFANDRLQVLKEIDVGRIRGLKAEEFRNRLMEAFKKYLPIPQNSADTRKDVISHFTLRLAFCATPEKRKWFVKQECDLFHHRVVSGKVDMADFLRENKMSEQGVTAEEFEELKADLQACHPRHKRNKVLKENSFYNPLHSHLTLDLTQTKTLKPNQTIGF